MRRQTPRSKKMIGEKKATESMRIVREKLAKREDEVAGIMRHCHRVMDNTHMPFDY